MLRKLIKHDFLSSNRYLWIGYVVVMAVAVLAGLVLRYALNAQTLFGGVSSMLIMLLMVMTMGALVALTYVIIFVHFYKNLLSGEGYLMNTLPVHTWELIVSKLINAVIQLLFACAAICAAVGVIWLISGSADIFGDMAADIFLMLKESGISGAAIVSGISGFAGMISFILDFYAAFALGQLINSHRVLFSLLFFMGIQMAEGIINTMFSVVQLFANADKYTITISSTIPSLIVTILFCIAAFIVTEQLLRKKLNLE